jgi:hypothetical protein
MGNDQTNHGPSTNLDVLPDSMGDTIVHEITAMHQITNPLKKSGRDDAITQFISFGICNRRESDPRKARN